METNNVVYWLHKLFEEEPTSRISFQEIETLMLSEFGNDCVQKRHLARYLLIAFPNIRRTKNRSPTDWRINITVYLGLRKRVTQNEGNGSPVELKDIPAIIPSDFFVMETSQSSITIGRMTGKTHHNGHEVFLKTSINQTGDVDIFVGGISVTSDTGICQQISLDRISFQAYINSLRSIRLCEGDRPEDDHRCIINEKGDGGPIRTSIFSADCRKIIHYKSYKSSKMCSECRKLSTTSESVHPGGDCKGESSNIMADPSFNASELDHILNLLEQNAPCLNTDQLSFIRSQIKNSNITDPRGRRWDNDSINLCLSIWTRSPRAYEQLCRCSGFVLPSTRTLSAHKNSVTQEPGINKEVLKWMYMEAKHVNLPPNGYHGGLILDEMSIQPDLQIVKSGITSSLNGFVELGEEASCISVTDKTNLADHVLQFMFHGFTGFRFLVAHYPTKQVNGTQIYALFWDVVEALESWGFHITYACMDGSANNRSFIKLNFDGPPTEHGMGTFNYFSGKPLFFLSDPSHAFKKIRNSIHQSGEEKWHTRLLIYDGCEITWKMWASCYEWDKAHGLSIHHRLSNEHIHPNQADKMRNHLAEEVLNDDMLHLMKRYREYLGDKGCTLNGAISLLEHTSKLVSFFRDQRPVKDHFDPRLNNLQLCQQWFSDWKKSSNKENMLSWETMEDISFLIIATLRIIEETTTSLDQPLIPMYLNSDILENTFSQQRGMHHGAGTNPNYKQYCYATNSITLCQQVISDKSNSARRKKPTAPGTTPYKQLCKEFGL